MANAGLESNEAYQEIQGKNEDGIPMTFVSQAPQLASYTHNCKKYEKGSYLKYLILVW